VTYKQDKILRTALNLFASKGYSATSTSSIAKEAGVSEGLIFKHFKNKEGLLHVLKQIGAQKADKVFERLDKIMDPLTVVENVLSLPFELPTEQHEFWRLFYSTKWQMGYSEDSLDCRLKEILTKAFKRLEYFQPEVEAQVVLSILDGMMTLILLQNPSNADQIKKTLLERYR